MNEACLHVRCGVLCLSRQNEAVPNWAEVGGRRSAIGIGQSSLSFPNLNWNKYSNEDPSVNRHVTTIVKEFQRP